MRVGRVTFHPDPDTYVEIESRDPFTRTWARHDIVKVCATQGCPTLTVDTYCELHHKARRKASDARRPSSSHRGYDTKWRRTRRRYLALHPICEYEAGCIAPATDVHHLDGRGPNGVNGHDDWNLQSLCHTHHSQISSREQAGGWNA